MTWRVVAAGLMLQLVSAVWGLATGANILSVVGMLAGFVVIVAGCMDEHCHEEYDLSEKHSYENDSSTASRTRGPEQS